MKTVQIKYVHTKMSNADSLGSEINQHKISPQKFSYMFREKWVKF